MFYQLKIWVGILLPDSFALDCDINNNKLY